MEDSLSVEEVKELRGPVVGRITYDVYLEITESGVDLGSVTSSQKGERVVVSR